MSYLVQASLIIGAYVVGSIPTGYLFAYTAGIKDIRQHGSGNIGATNVARILGLHYWLPVFFIDAAKAALYLILVKTYGYHEPLILICALALLAGNLHSLFLQFTGGKGVATIAGILCVLKPYLALLLASVWAAAIALTRTVGVASATACAALMVTSFYFFNADLCLCLTLLCMGAWGIWRHADNIKRYLNAPID